MDTIGGTDDTKYPEPSGHQPELIVLVGAPASGKSTLARYFESQYGYQRVNQDELKTKAKCLKAAREAIAEGKSLIIDNTNPTVEVRAEYLKLAHDATVKYATAAFELTTPYELCQELNRVRSETQPEIKKIPAIAYRVYYKKLIPPTTLEGFDRTGNLGTGNLGFPSTLPTQ